MSTWTDDEGRPLGEWAEVSREEWVALLVAAGGYDDLTVAASLTDPDGLYGQPQVYTAWARQGDQVPLADIRDIKDAHGSTKAQVFRKFVPREAAAMTEEDA